MQEVSTITAKGQTTVPAAVRRALGVQAGDRIAFKVEGEAVTLHRVQTSTDDPVVTRFLAFLEADMAANPGRIRALPADLRDRMTALTDGLEVDLDAPMEGKVAL